MPRRIFEGAIFLIRAMVCGLCAVPVLAAAPTGTSVNYIPSSDKGGFQYSQPSDWPAVDLDLAPIERQVATAARQRCATPLSAAPLDLGDAQGFMGKMAEKAAGAAVGKLLGGLLGGGGGSSQKKPDLHKDPIKSKFKEQIEHDGGEAAIRIGGQMYEDGMLISARVEKAAGKGTFHTMFLERPDCTRVWPEQWLRYALWGKWSLSVSVTKTTSTYRDGQFVDRSVSQSGWSKSGDFDFSRGFSLWDDVNNDDMRLTLDPDQAYLAQLRREIGTPAWQEMGFGEPSEGIRNAGGLFRVTPQDLTPGTIAVVHITHVDEGRYRTVGFPLRFSVGDEGHLSFEQMAP